MTQSLTRAVADFSKQLGAAVSISDTTAVLNNALDGDGVQLTNNRLYGFTVDTGSKKEYIIALLSNDNELSQIVNVSRQGAATSGFAKNHAVGSSVTITDWALLSRVVNLLDGSTDFDSGTPLKYDGAPAQTNPLALATVQFVLDTASGSTVIAFNPQTIDGQATDVDEDDWVYFDEATGLWERTDASDVATSVGVKIGKARGTVSSSSPAGITGGIFISGTETVGTYTAGQEYFLSNTAGELSTTAGDNRVKVGVGDENGDLVVTYNNPSELTPDKEDALTGGGDLGTPSAANKFITEDAFALKSDIIFGGDGSDGALTISSGTTTIDLGGARYFVKNYTSISITGTGKLAFSNPHANGTLITLKSKGDVTLTSSEAPMIDVSGLGAEGGIRTAVTPAKNGITSLFTAQTIAADGATENGSSSAGGAAGTTSVLFTPTSIWLKQLLLGCGSGGGGASDGSSSFPQSGGGGGGASIVTNGTAGQTMSGGASGSGSSTASTGGRGGGGLYIECGGAWNFTTTSGISVAGLSGTNGSGTRQVGGAGGGGGGSCVVLYNTLTSNSGTITVSGGAGLSGVSGGGNGGNGGAGYSLVTKNTEFA